LGGFILNPTVCTLLLITRIYSKEKKIKKGNNLNTYNVIHYFRSLFYEEQGDKAEAIAALEEIITHTYDSQWIKVAKQRIKELSK